MICLCFKAFGLNDDYIIYFGSYFFIQMLPKVNLLAAYHGKNLPSTAILWYSYIVRSSMLLFVLSSVHFLHRWLQHCIKNVGGRQDRFIHEVVKHSHLIHSKLCFDILVELLWDQADITFISLTSYFDRLISDKKQIKQIINFKNLWWLRWF